jgi:hypothetical protein
MMKIGPTLETKHEEVRKTRGREETGVGRRTKTKQKKLHLSKIDPTWRKQQLPHPQEVIAPFHPQLK